MLRALERMREGCLEMALPEGTRVFGDPGAGLRARVDVHDLRTFEAALLRGEVGLGEAYVEGWWSSPDPVAAVRVALRNMALLDGGALSAAGRAAARLRHLARANTRAGARRNIAAHYDLGNPFYRLWLDASLAYSSAFFPSETATLEEAQEAKYRMICGKLDLGPEDRLVEIGTGWGGFALHAARAHGCRITTTTISREQFDLATERVREAGLQDRIQVVMEDYRDLRGAFTKAVSIEMFEAVGLANYDAYFGAVDRLLEPGGRFLMQTITMEERHFEAYRRGVDFIQQHVFPGSQLASLLEVHRSLARATRLEMRGMEDLGLHYARTLRTWRERFHARGAEVAALGFDARFRRLWDYYLASCEGAFQERHVSVAQLVMEKGGGRP
ncbi:SAM-dependent methyltransferase [Mesoterricola sediminis]|uniref:Cyclopropane-fatty-acyl-phospholipid synthase n=1 Tax=Mesoterricola sediminis TaxID=2927980 RepID=A0AA48HG29_9BACT|nr:cyclopropane-fatty-acyl-phospholipid synthase family protein [Mesoterricola sediminis]BDU77553.1 cyclopropane-fatty-acyl-phospholipid synthase [Mesoterricola sediminis]